MSVIYPSQYKTIADRLGEAYALVRDSIFKDGSGSSDTAYSKIKAAAEVVSDSGEDETIRGCGAPISGESTDSTDVNYSIFISGIRYTAPPSSISNDLGTSWYSVLNTKLNETNAKKTAANLFSTALRKLNTHIVTRMYGYSTINNYYASYAFVSDAVHVSQGLGLGTLSLFDAAGAPSDDIYFTADFAELSTYAGNTVTSSYIAS